MAYEMKDGQGSLFQNKKKEKDSQPDLTGKAMVNGQMVDLSAWTKIDKNGNKWLSLSFKPPWKPEVRVAGDDDTGRPSESFADDIPW